MAKIGGVAEAIKNLTEAGATDPVVKATLRFSDSGFASITDAVAFGEIKDESITGTSFISIALKFSDMYPRETQRPILR